MGLRFVLACAMWIALPTATVNAQQSYGRIDIRCLRSSNEITFRTADTNVAIGYATWRSPNPR